jgi:hypothetical protein
MCDYSLHVVSSRPAKVGDKLVSSAFQRTSTLGFAAVGEPLVAVCLLPGTELVFEGNPRYGGFLGLFARRLSTPVARFRQVNVQNPHTHHDALEFPDGRVVSLQQLVPGQVATVLQLPSRSKPASEPTMPTMATDAQLTP